MDAVTWMQSHGCSHMDAVTWMQSHGCSHMDAVTWMQSHGCIKIILFYIKITMFLNSNHRLLKDFPKNENAPKLACHINFFRFCGRVLDILPTLHTPCVCCASILDYWSSYLLISVYCSIAVLLKELYIFDNG